MFFNLFFISKGNITNKECVLLTQFIGHKSFIPIACRDLETSNNSMKSLSSANPSSIIKSESINSSNNFPTNNIAFSDHVNVSEVNQQLKGKISSRECGALARTLSLFNSKSTASVFPKSCYEMIL